MSDKLTLLDERIAAIMAYMIVATTEQLESPTASFDFGFYAGVTAGKRIAAGEVTE